MALNQFECTLCGARRESLKVDPLCNHNQEEVDLPVKRTPMTRVLTAAHVKFMEPRSKEHGRSAIKGLNETLKQRAKEHAHLNDHDEFVQRNNDPLMAKAQGWLNQDGTKKKKIDLR